MRRISGGVELLGGAELLGPAAPPSAAPAVAVAPGGSKADADAAKTARARVVSSPPPGGAELLGAAASPPPSGRVELLGASASPPPNALSYHACTERPNIETAAAALALTAAA